MAKLISPLSVLFSYRMQQLSSIFHFNVLIVSPRPLLHKDYAGLFLYAVHSLISICWLISSIHGPSCYPSFVKTYNYLSCYCLRVHFLQWLLSSSPLIRYSGKSKSTVFSWKSSPHQFNRELNHRYSLCSPDVTAKESTLPFLAVLKNRAKTLRAVCQYNDAAPVPNCLYFISTLSQKTFRRKLFNCSLVPFLLKLQILYLVLQSGISLPFTLLLCLQGDVFIHYYCCL